MTGFAMVLGGMAKGVGGGLLEAARAKREAALKEIEEARQDRRLQEDREFRSQEAAIGRSAQAAENEKDRAERRADREMTGGSYQETDEGIVHIKGGKATQVTGADGKPVTKKKDMPTAEEFEKMVETATKTEVGESMVPPKPAEVDAIRERNRLRLRQSFGMDGDKDATPKVPAPPAPRDPTKRKVGQVYSSPSGAEGRWTGDGWEPVG